MSGRIVPETAKRPDWPRLVAAGHKDHEGRIAALEVIGAEYSGTRAITASGNVATDDYLILADATSGAITVTLPLAADSAGRQLVVKKTDASGNAVTIDGNGAETIDGAANTVLAAQYNSVTVLCDGTGWWII